MGLMAGQWIAVLSVVGVGATLDAIGRRVNSGRRSRPIPMPGALDGLPCPSHSYAHRPGPTPRGPGTPAPSRLRAFPVYMW